MEVVQHVFEISLPPYMYFFSAFLHFGVAIRLEPLILQYVEYVVLVAHAHLNVGFIEAELLKVDVAGGRTACALLLDQLKVLGETQADVLIKIVVNGMNQGRREKLWSVRFILIEIFLSILGYKFFIARAIVSG